MKSTRKITSAMKMVAASKLKRAQTQAEAARPYAERMQRMLAALAASVAGLADGAAHAGRHRAGTRCICWSWSPPTAAWPARSTPMSGRAARTAIQRLEGEGKTVKVLTVGRKGRDYLRREYASRLVGEIQLRRQEAGRVRRRQRGRGAGHGHAGGRRVRRLHAHLQPLRLGDQPDADRDAADPAARCRRPTPAPPAPARRRSTSSSRTRRRSSPRCCRATWRSSSSAR